MQALLKSEGDRIRVAQWLADEGSVSVQFERRVDSTYLQLCGSMVDSLALGEIAHILRKNVFSVTRELTQGWLPMMYVKVVGPEAYSSLEAIRSNLIGLKAFEVDEALKFFPRSGVVKGRHTTDEFLTPAWIRFGELVLETWNSRRAAHLTKLELRHLLSGWLESRRRRARRYLPLEFPSN
jgi:hypothetical protein